MARAVFIEHDHVSPPGAVGRRFAERGYDVEELLVVPEDRFHAPDVEIEFPELRPGDVLVPMGAPWSAYDLPAIGSWVVPELDLLRRADAVGIGVLGICFGGQLLALAHGGDVAASPHPELGWTEVTSDDPSLVPPGPWFQWHDDRWTTPPGAREIARNAAAPQAFVLRHSLALQFHPELDESMLSGWLSNGGSRVLEQRGLDVGALLHETRTRADDAGRRTAALVDAFLDRIVPGSDPGPPTYDASHAR